MRHVLISLSLFATGCATTRHLDDKLPWFGQNRAALDAMIQLRGKSSPTYDPAHKPVATFDWDNTNIRNDAGDATMFYMLAHDKVLQPPSKSWRLTSPFLTPEAVTALDTACATLADPGKPLPTSSDSNSPNGQTCAAEIGASSGPTCTQERPFRPCSSGSECVGWPPNTSTISSR